MIGFNTKTYTMEQVVVIINGFKLEDFEEITTGMKESEVDWKQIGKGSPLRVMKSKPVGFVRIKIPKGANGNQILHGLNTLNKLVSELGVDAAKGLTNVSIDNFEFVSVSDLNNGTDIFILKNATVIKIPDKTHSEDATANEWEIEGVSLIRFETTQEFTV